MTIKVGILGFAHGHVNAYCNEWSQKPDLDIQVKAAWDHDRNRLEQSAKTYNIKACSTVEEILSDVDIKAVVISAETSFHANLVEKAASAGKTIIVQKPIAMTMAEADRVVDAVNRHHVPFTMAWQMRTDPQNNKMKEMIKSGILGKIFMVRRRHGLNTHQWKDFEQAWHVQPEYNRDIWADDSSHAVDFIHWLLGVPESVTAEMMSLLNPKIPMDNGIAIYRYPGGPIAEVTCSFTCPAAENTTEIIAEKGSIIQNFGDVPSCNIPSEKEPRGLKWFLTEKNQWEYSNIPTPSNHGGRIAGLATPLADFLHGKRAPIATAEEGRTTLRMVLATYVSTREGRRVQIDEDSVYGI